MIQPYVARLGAIVDYWNIAEAEIKQCELLRHEVAFATVNELRYAGRRLVDALQYASSTPQAFGITQAELDVHLERAFIDAEQYCQRAHHDAIDSEVFFIRDYIDLLVKRVGTPGCQ